MSYADTFEPEPESDELVQIMAGLLPWAIVGAFCIWAGWGWLASGVNALSLMLAIVFGLFQIATNILAVMIRGLAQRHAWLTCGGAIAAMVATGLLTHESLDHAYAVTLERGYASADPALMSWLLLAVPYLEPLFFWINRLMSEPRKPSAVQAAKVGVITALWAWLFGPAAVALAEPPSNVIPLTRDPGPIVQRISRQQQQSLEPRRAQAKLMAKTGAKARDIHETTGVPLSTCKRYVAAA